MPECLVDCRNAKLARLVRDNYGDSQLHGGQNAIPRCKVCCYDHDRTSRTCSEFPIKKII
jgi:hypothetical protein